MKYTIVIQGPLHETSILNIENYLKFGNIIVSCYNEDNFQLLNNVKENFYKIVKQNMPNYENIVGIGIKDNFFRGLMSTYLGVKNSDTEYIIKTRSDESYTDLTEIINLFEKDNEKLVCGNLYAAPPHVYVYHIGDHIYIVKKKYLEKALETLINMYNGNTQIEEWAYWMCGRHNSPENILAKAFLLSKGVDINSTKYRKIFYENFEVIDVNKLGNTICRGNHPEIREWRNNFVNGFKVYDSKTVFENDYDNPVAGFPYVRFD